MISQAIRRTVTLATLGAVGFLSLGSLVLHQRSSNDLFYPPSNLGELISKASEATFEIHCHRDEDEFYSGTGWNLTIGEANYAITNAHVISECIGDYDLFLKDHRGDLHATEILGYRHVEDFRGSFDIAVLSGRSELPTLKLASVQPEPGHWVLAVGWPVLYDSSYKAVVQGHITGTPTGGDLVSDMDMHGGSSGSALMNSRGEVIGVHYSSTREDTKRALAQPISRLCGVALVCDEQSNPLNPLKFPENPIKTFIPKREE